MVDKLNSNSPIHRPVNVGSSGIAGKKSKTAKKSSSTTKTQSKSTKPIELALKEYTKQHPEHVITEEVFVDIVLSNALGEKLKGYSGYNKLVKQVKDAYEENDQLHQMYEKLVARNY